MVMAQRGEGQGLQIAVISFAILAILLAGASFFFFSSAQTAKKELEVKNKTAADQQQQINQLMYRVDAMSYVLGIDGKTKEELEISKGRAGGDDPKVKEILDNFNSDVALVGDQVGSEGTKSYRTFTTALIAALNRKNASVSDAMEQGRSAQLARDKVALDEKTRADTTVAAAEKAANDYKQQAETFATDRAAMEEEKGKYTIQLTG